MFRAFFGIPALSNASGTPTNAVLGFTRMLINLFKKEKPDYIAVAFDVKGPTFRHKIYKEYKAHRPPTPPDLVPQISLIKEVVRVLNIPLFEIQGYEADDIIGTLVREAEEAEINCIVATSDKDMMQLVNDNVLVLDELKKKLYRSEEVKEKLGVYPESVVDYLALVGDASDNVPGVRGIGPKTAVTLLNQFSTLENLLKNIPKVKGAKKQELLEANRDNAILSRTLVTIDRHVPITFDPESLKPTKPDMEAVHELFSRLEFSRLLTLLSEVFDVGECEEANKTQDCEYITVSSLADFETLLKKLESSEFFVMDTETTSKEPVRAELVGISFCLSPEKAYYIPVGHNTLLSPHPQLDFDTVISSLKPILENADIKKGGQNIKYDIIVFKKYGVNVEGISFDTMVASYLLNPTKRHNLNDMALEHLGYKTISYEEVAGKGKQQICFDQVPVQVAAKYSGEDSEVTLHLVELFKPILQKESLLRRFEDVEMPIIPVLADMERYGVKINTPLLAKMSKEIKEEMKILEDKIFIMAGEPFNIASPKQLSYILFEKMGLPAIKKTKTGYSTNIDVLEELALQSGFPSKVLEYRTLKKITSTYVDALPQLVNPRTKRVHTSFNQAVTATGRLSSSNPNLQNIPVRNDIGKRVREAFEADKGKVLLSADYSQIELRVLAHFSKDPRLMNAFKNDEDIHAITASEIFSLDSEFITSEMRRKAKVVNFGIIYGMGAYGLSKDLHISMGEANSYIKSYYKVYAGVEEFREKIIRETEESGWVSTLLGHRRKIPELKSKNRNVHQAGERIAINTPIQGTAAELIKLAMINIHKKFKNSNIKMVLQIHDELIFELPIEDLELAKCEIKKEMEDVYPLNVPLIVNISHGKNWGELK